MSDEERDLRKYSRRSAIGLMGVGGGLAATETLGFTNVTADRGTNIGINTDSDALLRVAVNQGQNSDFDEELTDQPFSGDSSIEFVNQSNVAIEDAGEGLEVTIDATDSTGETSLDIGENNGVFSIEGTDATEGLVTATADLASSGGENDTGVLIVSPTDDGEDSPVADFSIEADFGGGSVITFDRNNIEFQE